MTVAFTRQGPRTKSWRFLLFVRYSEEQKKRAVVTYWRVRSVYKTQQRLGYPVDVHTLLDWVRERNKFGTLLARAYVKTSEKPALLLNYFSNI